VNKIYGVSLGPGDPDLITVKGLKTLQDSDLIFYPGSLFANGTKESYVLPMLEHYIQDKNKLQGFFLKMGLDRSAAEVTYDETTVILVNAWEQGKKISIACEGDLSFYASFSYLLQRLQQQNIPVELIPGINSFSSGAAKHQVPLCLQNEKLVFLPLEHSIEKIEHTLKDFDTLVLMKIRTGLHTLLPHLLTKNWRFYYCERLGTVNEYITSDIRELHQRDIPYFSLLIIKK
jgi:precorrin-2/cobalt-factor-2 C20-methyltransferase